MPRDVTSFYTEEDLDKILATIDALPPGPFIIEGPAVENEMVDRTEVTFEEALLDRLNIAYFWYEYAMSQIGLKTDMQRQGRLMQIHKKSDALLSSLSLDADDHPDDAVWVGGLEMTLSDLAGRDPNVEKNIWFIVRAIRNLKSAAKVALDELGEVKPTGKKDLRANATVKNEFISDLAKVWLDLVGGQPGYSNASDKVSGKAVAFIEACLVPVKNIQSTSKSTIRECIRNARDQEKSE